MKATRMSPTHLGSTSHPHPSCSILDGDSTAQWGLTTLLPDEKVIAAQLAHVCRLILTRFESDHFAGA